MEAEREKNRIRDNQRRSRARKKEYLQNLENRLRECQLQGVTASAEVQQAARRVAEENQKLRQLLGNLGVSGDRVDQYLSTGRLDPSDRSAPQAPSMESDLRGHAATALDRAMAPRRPVFYTPPKPTGSSSQHTSTESVLSYETTSNSPAGSYDAASEGFRQPQYEPEPAGSLEIAHPLSRRPWEAHDQRYALEDHNPLGSRWHPDPSAHDSSLAINLQGYGANQTLEFHPSYPGTESAGDPIPPTCQAQIVPQYSAYETIHQAPNFISHHMGAGHVSHSGPTSVADTDSSAEDRRPRRAGELEEYQWTSADPLMRTHYGARRG
ncbi:hypothetical protein CMUS01_07438 [Colletotrichum musicola]|uniref:BZIP domain-containing protein n=1 Tax=Colletotrichum musicola TaxID=2175873 RepID=A0A8H6KH08_9PEZI|nr:hypothetical protein CMUS01_07438 [Colletotrichum musicola]